MGKMHPVKLENVGVAMSVLTREGGYQTDADMVVRLILTVSRIGAKGAVPIMDLVTLNIVNSTHP